MAKSIGKKTQALIKMIENGFNVPPFVYISAEEISNLKSVDNLIKEKISKLNCDLYAVRSSALIEDTGSKSYAGQFMTKVAQNKDQLKDAFTQVVDQAKDFLKGDLSKFSVIIQEYIPADKSGILFTRNPLGGREIIVESHTGIGEDIVGGKIKPEKKIYYWNKKGDELVETAKKLEGFFGFPQDIEWCMKDGKYYILQSRPITTISKDQYAQYLYLDSVLPKDGDFLYEKTEVSEIAERPTPFTYSLLEKIYSKGGPVDEVYKKYGVRYEYNNFLKIIGNELFVDRQMEIKSLLPSYGFLKNADGKPHLSSLKGIGRTLGNFFSLNKISLSNYDKLKADIKNRLESVLPKDVPFGERINRFLDDYKLIFEVNLLTEKALKKMYFVLKAQKVSMSSMLAYPFDNTEEIINFDTKALKGNCLEIADETDFINKKIFLSEDKKDKEIKKWHESLSPFQQKYFVPIIIQAQKYSQLREYGRWLTVKNINYLRDGLPNINNKYFANIDEIKNEIIDAEIVDKRKGEYEMYSKFQMPVQLTNIQFDSKVKSIGVSSGKAIGKLVRLNDLNSLEKSILYTNILSPDIAKDFDKISGIISQQGGLLSHLSIMARENKIPVVVQVDIGLLNINIGDVVEIDGGTGIVRHA